MQSRKVTSVLLLVMISVVLMSIFTPIRVFANEGQSGTNNTTRDIFKDFNIEVTNDGDGNSGKTQIKVTSAANQNAWQTLLDKYKGFITGVAAVGAVTMVVLFIIQFLKLGASSGNPQARSQALIGVLWTGIAAAGLGAVAIITGLFYNAVK